MHVRTTRRRTIAVAAMATIFMLSVVGPEVARAATPPGLGRFMNAIGHVESGGRYTARNATSGAYGKYQIMPANWPSWARRYLGNSRAPQTPINQERVARGKFTSLYRGLGSWRRVAYWWLTGSSQGTAWSGYAVSYVNRVMGRYRVASPRIPTGSGAPSTVSLKHYSERSAKVTYTGPWRSARHTLYAGDRVRYSTVAGATATLTFTGRKVIWYGPVGPTRGKATVAIDGKVVRTIDLRRRSFDARAAIFSRTWSKPGAHSITITVLGSGARPMVAIDEFVVRR